VQLGDLFGGLAVEGSKYSAVRLVEIADGGSFTQELRAGDNCKWDWF